MDVAEALKTALLSSCSTEDECEFKEEFMHLEECSRQEYSEACFIDTNTTKLENYLKTCCEYEMKTEVSDNCYNTFDQRDTELSSMELQRVSMEQLVTMIEFLDSNPHLARGVNPGIGTQHEVDRLWTELTRSLHSKGKAKKTTHQWKKYWSTLKCRIKKKAASLRSGGSGTLSALEGRVLTILGDDIASFDLNPESKTEAENPICTSPSPHAYDDDFSWPSEEEVTIKEGSPPRIPSPKRPRRSFVRSRPVRSRNTSQISSSTFEPWLVALERRRVAAEEKMADAMKTMADAALLNAQTLRMCAQAGINLRASNGHDN